MPRRRMIFLDTSAVSTTVKNSDKDLMLLRYKFKSEDGEEFIWTPKWDEVRRLFETAVLWEYENYETLYPGGSPRELNKFAKCALNSADFIKQFGGAVCAER